LRHRPRAWIGGVVRGALLYTLPATDQYHLRERRQRVAALDDVARVVVTGQIPQGLLETILGPARDRSLSALCREVGWLVVAAHALVLVRVVRTIRGWRRRRACSPPDGAVLFACGVVLWIGVLTPFVECGENFRFRVMIEPLLLVVAASSVRWRTRHSPS
jgi:hypothetical protein